MKKNIIILIISLIFVAFIISSLIVYAGSTKQETTMEQKVTQEILYLNNNIISILGNLNGFTIGEYTIQVSPQKTTPEQSETIEQGKEQTSQEGSNSTQSGSSSGGSSQGSDSGKEKSQSGTKDSQEEQNAQSNKTQNNVLSKNGKFTPNWEKAQLQIEQLYQTWNTVSIDLHALSVDGNLILKFTDILNNATVSCKNKDKAKVIDNLANLHQLLPQYMKSYQLDDNKTMILTIESDVVNSYANITNDKWQDADNNLIDAEKTFSNLLNSVNLSSQNQIIMNQAYVLVNELRKAVKIQDKEIFYIQYQSFIAKIGIIM